MLTVNTFLDKSPIHGFGCFAEETIPAGSILWTLRDDFDGVFDMNKYSALPLVAKKFVDHFGYYNEHEGGWVLCMDNAKYFNHSDNPNCVAQGLNTVAVRDIIIGEEITEDYFNFDMAAADKLIYKIK